MILRRSREIRLKIAGLEIASQHRALGRAARTPHLAGVSFMLSAVVIPMPTSTPTRGG